MEINKAKISHLKELLKKSNSKNESDRLRSILCHFEFQKTAKEIAQFMYLHVHTIQNYINDYIKKEKTENDPRGGSSSKLTEQQSQELKSHLQENTYFKAKNVAAYIKEKYQVFYTTSGMTFWLKENGFVYKKPVHIPGRLKPEKQAIFIEEYQALKSSLSEKETIIFMDAVHPEHQSRPSYGWISKGETKHLSSTARQERINIIGGLELGSSKDPKHILTNLEVKSVNADEAIRFLELLQKNYADKDKIYIVCDNGPAFTSKKFKAYVEKSLKIKIKYLPAYSPNLNPIERVWKVLREEVQYNKYYEKFINFRIKVNEFFEKTFYSIKNKIYSRVNDHFQIFTPNLIKIAEHST